MLGILENLEYKIYWENMEYTEYRRLPTFPAGGGGWVCGLLDQMEIKLTSASLLAWALAELGKKNLVPTLCLLNVGTVPMLYILNVGTVLMLCILDVGTFPTLCILNIRIVLTLAL